MCQNLSQKASNSIARQEAEDTGLKMRLEDQVRPGIRQVFGRIIRDFSDAILITGEPPQSLTFYESQFRSLLITHYQRVQNKALGLTSRRLGLRDFTFLRKQLGDEGELSAEEEAIIAAIIAASLLSWRDFTSGRQSKVTIRAIQAEFVPITNKARKQLFDEGIEVTNRSLAVAATQLLRNNLSPKIDRTAILETEASFESTKIIESEAISGRTPFPLKDEKFNRITVLRGQEARLFQLIREQRRLFKVWNSQRDAKVRPSHAAMNAARARLSLDGLFVVGRSRSIMLFPADTSRGARQEEIQRCRCFLIIVS